VNASGDYFLRVDLQNGTLVNSLVNFQLEIYVNNNKVNVHNTSATYSNYTFSIYPFSIIAASQIQLKYTGPSFPVAIKNTSQDIFDTSSSSLFSLPAANSNVVQVYNLTAVDTYYAIIEHGISSTTSVTPFSLVVEKIPCAAGFYMNTTMFTCVRDCSGVRGSY